MRDECSLNMLIDKFSFYNKELKAFEIQAQSQPSLGMVEGSSLHLGCIACTKEQAATSCIRGYHLCTSMEIYSGVYNVIRSLGWVEWDPNIWTLNMLTESNESLNSGSAVCCID